jgi:F-type H+-transporting ATPase subunit epsilon
VHLTLFLPSEIFLDEQVSKVIGESTGGSFCLLPRHIDYLTALVPGILCYVLPSGKEHFLAVDGGLLVKQQDRVLVVTRRAVRGALGQLQQEVESMLTDLDDKEKSTRTALARLEAGFLRRFMEFGKNV